jgi:hypothetical protein
LVLASHLARRRSLTSSSGSSINGSSSSSSSAATTQHSEPQLAELTERVARAIACGLVRDESDAIRQHYNGKNSGGSSGNGVAASNFYTKQLELDAACELLKQHKLLQGAARVEAAALGEPVAEYLQRIKAAQDDFFANDVLYDREAFRAALDGMVGSKGSFSLVLGSKSIGKSYVLRHEVTALNKKHPGRVVLVDARRAGNVLTGVLHSLKETNSPVWKSWLETFAPLGSAALLDATGVVPTSISKFVGEVIKRTIDDKEAAKSFIENSLAAFADQFKSESFVPTLVIDEANQMFPRSADKDRDYDARHTSMLLDAFILFTKQCRSMNVVLVSSEYAFPYDRGKHLPNIKAVLIAPEMPPSHMYALLRDEWRVGDALAMAMLSVYGGHVYNCDDALQRLTGRGSAVFDVSHGFTAARNPNTFKLVCGDPTMRRGLEELALCGITQQLDETQMERLNASNIAATVDLGLCQLPSVPRELRVSLPRGVPTCVVSNQSTRLIIARDLADAAVVAAEAKEAADALAAKEAAAAAAKEAADLAAAAAAKKWWQWWR